MRKMRRHHPRPFLRRDMEVKMPDLKSLTHTIKPLSSTSQGPKRWGAATAVVGLVIYLTLGLVPSALGQEAEWIWASGVSKESIPNQTCHFRRTFTVQRPEAGELTIAADDTYEVYINGKKIGTGQGYRQLDRYDIGKMLGRGKNVVAVKVANTDGGTAALAVRLQVKEQQGNWLSFSTNSSWKTNLRPLPLWHMPIYNDRRWATAQSFGKLGSTVPWDRPKGVAVEQQQSYERFKIAREFEVQRVLDDETIGSAIAIAFNEFGQLLVSQEGGPLEIVSFDETGMPGAPQTYCDLVSSCQGILPLNGEVYVTGQGPEGLGIYLLKDLDRDGKMEEAKRVLPFKGGLGEHGPHGLALGPDGKVYCTVGNHSGYAGSYAETSPVSHFYEGDLVKPKYEDPSGHAVGIQAPGGVIFRMDLDGENVELFASGIRNAYDLAFNEQGELFTYDSDMESDLGMAWYRPTRVMHVLPGSEFGWRSGWSKWPNYYADVVPPLVETGRGSPTGVVAYNHFMFPTKYHDALFVGDWSEGRILAVTLQRDGAGYQANTEVFLQGEPLNVTDLAVGPDGDLYFSTGGRSTSGGIYRIRWRGTVPKSIKELPRDLTGVIRQPQLQAAWSRQVIASLRQEIGDDWGALLQGVAIANENPSQYRVRALDLMQLYGPQPTTELLGGLMDDQNEEVRAKAVELLGLLEPTDETQRLLTKALDDDDRLVRRRTCEAMLRSQQYPEFDSIKRILISDDRSEAWAARRLLEKIPFEQWREAMLETENHRLFIQCGLAAMIAHPSKKNSYDVLARASTVMEGFVSDRNFIEVLRVIELALERGEVDPGQIPAFSADVADEFPSGNALMNRELARILAYLNEVSISDRYVEYLGSDVVDPTDKIHVAILLQTIREGWSSESRLAMVDFLETARSNEGGGSYEYYVMQAARDFAKTLEDEDVPLVLANGHKWPNAALSAFYKLPKQLDEETIEMIKAIDDQTLDVDPEDDSYTELKIGIVAVLGRSGDETSMAYLREMWDRDPDRRPVIAMGLAQKPEGENWSYLVNSLGVMEEESARDVLSKLIAVDQRPSDPEHYRQLILLGLRLRENGADQTVELIQNWTGEHLSLEGDPWQESLAIWQEWFSRRFPDYPPAELAKSSSTDKWEFAELLEYLETVATDEGAQERGRELFVKAQCANCHRYANKGESLGPDLTALSRRFTRKEVLESILHPSQVISDQYQTKVVTTVDGQQHSGLLTTDANGNHVVLTSDGKKITVLQEDVDEIAVSNVSSMPTGLIDNLTVEEVADLFAFLLQGSRRTVATRPESDNR
jgi:putative heme-binding domain-containing protein